MVLVPSLPQSGTFSERRGYLFYFQFTPKVKAGCLE